MSVNMKKLIIAFLMGLETSEKIEGFYLCNNVLRYHYVHAGKDYHIVVATIINTKMMKPLLAINTFRLQNRDSFASIVNSLEQIASVLNRFNIAHVPFADIEVADGFYGETLHNMVCEYNALIKCFMSKSTRMPSIFECAVKMHNYIAMYSSAVGNSTMPQGMTPITKAKYKYDEITNVHP